MALDVYEMLIATYAVLDQPMNDFALKAMAADLKGYDTQAIGMALMRARRELRRMTLADIIERIPGEHPGAEEAWATVAQTMNNEAVSVAWTQPMATAYGVAYYLIADPVAARMAFKEVYQREVSLARSRGAPTRWFATLGTDAGGRENALEKARAMNALAISSIPALALPTLPSLDSEIRTRHEA